MKNGVKVFVGSVLASFMVFSGIGYAQLTGTLDIAGSLALEAQRGVFISDVEIAEGVQATVNSYVSTVMNSTVTLGEAPSSTVSFDITVYNNSSYVYVFNGVVYEVGEETYDNENVTFELTDLVKGQELAEAQSLTFTITFSYENGANVTDNVLNSVLNFEFVLDSEYIPEYMAEGALGKFQEILNTPADHQALLDQMSKYAESDRANDSYIGNVVGATSDDTVPIESLFTEGDNTYLTLVINDEKTQVTAMIKRENVDGDTNTGDENGNEMTIYMTADDISSLGFWNSTVFVYAGVFTKLEGASEWTQLGDLYEGTATANNYSGGWGRNSFNTDTWRSSLAYHGVARNSTITAVIAGFKNSQIKSYP